MRKIKEGDVVDLPCGARVKVDKICAEDDPFLGSTGIISVRVLSERGMYDSDNKHVRGVTLNFYPSNIRTLIETLERIEKVVCPSKS